MNTLVLERVSKYRLLLVLIIVAFMFFPYVMVFASELGGLISEKLIDRSGVGSSSLVIGRSGQADSQLDMAMGVIVSTLPATNVGTKQATLNGNLSDLNGFPQATVYFEWGYDTNYGNTTSSEVMSGLGGFSAPISGYDVKKPIYFRSVGETYGINYGGSQVFEVGGFVTAHDLLRYILPLIIFVAMCMVAIRFKSPQIVIAGIATALLCYIIILAVLDIPF